MNDEQMAEFLYILRGIWQELIKIQEAIKDSTKGRG